MNRKSLKNIGIYCAIIAFFFILSYAFVPQVLGGKIVNQSDISGWKGMAQESLQWNKTNPDDKTAWTDSMFGGMPNVTFIDEFEGDWTKPLYKALLMGKRPASYLFIALVGAFLMMLAFGVNRFLAVAGAIAVAFCAYNFQIIQVGHNTKMQAIAFAPWAIAAMVFTYRAALGEISKLSNRRKWVSLSALGSALFALALSMQIKANHVQISYYLAIIILIYVLATLVWVLLKENRSKFGRFAAASGMLLVFGLVGIGTNANKLLPTYEYTPFTMRGGSELVQEKRQGLDLGYATDWSYGIEETPNLLIANYNGGSSSGSLGKKSATYQLFKRAGQNARQICQALPLYWGPQPFTAGPMYIGAISIFLFILGLCVLEGREKWWLAACVVLAILLSWGRHFMWFTELWFKYVPLYNKFRTVSMALVILQFCVPLLGIYALDKIFKVEVAPRKAVRGTWIALGITAGFCALSALFPALAGDFIASSDSQMQEIIVEALREDRIQLMKVDAWRSFLLIVLSAGAIIWCFMKKNGGAPGKRALVATALIACLILVDLWSMGKRYLNEGHFVTPKDFSAKFDLREVDKYILEDDDPSYRVLDLSESTFNSSVSSFRHKSIGGYSPTKMQRYQDLIDRYISPEMSTFYKAVSEAESFEGMQNAVPYMPVVSMLNGRYIIVAADYPPLVNPYAFGEAWFVDEVVAADSANEEITLLGALDLEKQAVVRKGTVSVEACDNQNAEIELLEYAPNQLRYSYACRNDAFAVFSEIYHPSWKAVLVKDGGPFESGEPLELVQTNWVLRGALLPKGEGQIVMRYEPKDYATGRRISLLCSILLLLVVLGSVGLSLIPKGKFPARK